MAALALHGSGFDPGNDYWLCATPVHMQVRRDQMILMPPHLLTVGADEAADLIASLEAHFAADSLEFRAATPADWYLRCPERPKLTTTSPELAAGRNVDPLLPAGKDRLDFHRLINEAQMLLHEHPVNVRREAIGAPAINSVWLWGGGTLPSTARSPWKRVASSRALERGLARLAGVPTGSLDPAPPAEGLYVLPDSAEQAWAGPLLVQVETGKLDRLDLVVQHAGRALQWTLRRTDLWKFWRRPRSLEALLQEAAQ